MVHLRSALLHHASLHGAQKWCTSCSIEHFCTIQEHFLHHGVLAGHLWSTFSTVGLFLQHEELNGVQMETVIRRYP